MKINKIFEEFHILLESSNNQFKYKVKKKCNECQFLRINIENDYLIKILTIKNFNI